jgi:hypothetical protein
MYIWFYFFHYINYTMNTEALFLFLILLLGLVLCSFLGGNCGKEGYSNHNEDNHDGTSHHGHSSHHGYPSHHGTSHHSHSSHHSQPSHHDPTSHYGHSSYHSTSSSSSSSPSTGYDNYNHYAGSSSAITNGTTFYGYNGDTAIINTGSNGLQTIALNQTGSSTPTVFTQTSSNSKTFTGPFGGFSATITTGSNGQPTIQFTLPNGTTQIFTEQSSSSPSQSPANQTTTSSSQYYGSTGTPIQSSPYNMAYQQPNNSYNQSQGNSTQGNTAYYSSLPPGIPGSQIQPGQEDLYILKSEVVPPVCPACPVSSACPKKEKCPPCPACARCPEPSFECKKVPNYNSIDESYLPEPVLNDFSQFGM